MSSSGGDSDFASDSDYSDPETSSVAEDSLYHDADESQDDDSGVDSPPASEPLSSDGPDADEVDADEVEGDDEYEDAADEVYEDAGGSETGEIAADDSDDSEDIGALDDDEAPSTSEDEDDDHSEDDTIWSTDDSSSELGVGGSNAHSVYDLSLARQAARSAGFARLKTTCDALLMGSDHRPGLPIELVRLISFAGPFSLPAPHLDVREQRSFSVFAPGSAVVRECLLVTNAFDEQSLLRTASVQLITWSGHQGWVGLPDQGSWSWFELAIVSASDVEDGGNPSRVNYSRVKLRSNGSPLAWDSHRHPIHLPSPIAKYDGAVFDADHELWRHLEPGDRLAVFGCAQYGAWQCRAECATLLFDEYFDPL